MGATRRPASARILIACWGSYGDLFPSLALARRLQASGHTPVVATCGYYQAIVERSGVEHLAVPPDVDPDDADLIARVMDPYRASEVVVGELTAPEVGRAFEVLSPAAAASDLILSHPMTFAAPLAARVHGRPWLSTVLAPASFFSAYDFPLLPPQPGIARLARSHPAVARGFMRFARRVTAPWTAPVRELRQALGLSDTGDPLYEGQFSPFGTLALFSPVIGKPQGDWPAHTTLTGFAFLDDEEELPSGLTAFLDRGPAPVVFTLGSSAVGAPGGFFQESVAAAKRLGRRAVLLAGRRSGLEDGRLDDDCFVAGYTPHAPLFRRAAAIVHHGGVGTLGQALRAGRPMLVVPHAHDQPDNAERARRLGLSATVDARRYTARRAADRLAPLLESASCRSRAERVGRQVEAEDGAGEACRAIAAVLASTRS